MVHSVSGHCMYDRYGTGSKGMLAATRILGRPSALSRETARSKG